MDGPLILIVNHACLILKGVIPTDGWKIAIMLIGIVSDTKSSPKNTEDKSDTSE